MNMPAESKKTPIDSLEISTALVRLIQQQQGLQLSIEDIGARPSLSTNGQFLYMIITLSNGIDDTVVKTLGTVSKHIRTAVGVWVLSEREVSRILRSAQCFEAAQTNR